MGLCFYLHGESSNAMFPRIWRLNWPTTIEVGRIHFFRHLDLLSQLGMQCKYRMHFLPRLSSTVRLVSFVVYPFLQVSTYVLPTEVFPKDVRSSMHGVSAGMGKVGALLGSVVFTQLNSISVSLTFTACIVACCWGVFVTWRFVEPQYQNTFFVGHPLRPEGRRIPIEQFNQRDSDVEK
jgi:hypothetical protein